MLAHYYFLFFPFIFHLGSAGVQKNSPETGFSLKLFSSQRLNVPQSCSASLPLSNGNQNRLTLLVCGSPTAVGGKDVDMGRRSGRRERAGKCLKTWGQTMDSLHLYA